MQQQEEEKRIIDERNQSPGLSSLPTTVYTLLPRMTVMYPKYSRILHIRSVPYSTVPVGYNKEGYCNYEFFKKSRSVQGFVLRVTALPVMVNIPYVVYCIFIDYNCKLSKN